MGKKNSPNPALLTASQVAEVIAWQLPSFDEGAVNVIENGQLEEQSEPEEDQVEVEEVEIETVKPLTLEEVEAVRQDAYNEGFAAGEKDGFHSGQVKAQKEAEAALAPRLAALEQIMAQLFEPISKQDQELEQSMLHLVQLISQQVIQRELVLDSSQISQIVQQSLKLLPLEGEQVRIFLNPQDHDTITALRKKHEENWRVVEDDSLSPGGCRIETSHSRVDATIETRLEALSRQLLEQQRSLQAEPVAADDIQEINFAESADIAAES